MKFSNMDAQEKIELIVDRLLVKTQDNHCKWIKKSIKL